MLRHRPYGGGTSEKGGVSGSAKRPVMSCISVCERRFCRHVTRRPSVNLNEVPSIAVGSDRRKSAKDESAQSGVGRFPSAPDLHPQQRTQAQARWWQPSRAGRSRQQHLRSRGRCLENHHRCRLRRKHARRHACPMGSRLIWNACAERAPVQRDDAFVTAGEAALMLGNQDRLEAAVAIAGDVAPDRAAIGDDRFAASAVALVGLPSGLDGLCR